MTDREKAIIMAYTGITMLTGERIDEFYKYLAELCGRPVYTHEIVNLDIQNKAKQDFINLCREAEPQRKKGKWLDNETSFSDDVPQTCTCSVCGMRSRRPIGDFCKWCGADMRENSDNQITVCPMWPECPDNCPLGADMEGEADG